MIACTCLVQAGQISAETQGALRESIDGFARRALGAPAEITWTEVPRNSGYTANAPSTSSIVSIRANAKLDQPRRVTLLEELCGLWMEQTKCSLNEIVGVISDPQES